LNMLAKLEILVFVLLIALLVWFGYMLYQAEEEREKSKQTVEKLKEKLRSKEQEIRLLTEDKQKLKEEIEKLKKEREEAKKKEAVLIREYARLSSFLQSKDETIEEIKQSYEEEIKKLKQEISKRDTEIHRLRSILNGKLIDNIKQIDQNVIVKALRQRPDRKVIIKRLEKD